MRDGDLVTLKGIVRVHARTVPSPLTDTPCVAWRLRIDGPADASGELIPSESNSVMEHGGVVFRLESKAGDVLVAPPISDPLPASWLTEPKPVWHDTLELPPATLQLIKLEPPPIIPRRLEREEALLRARGIRLPLRLIHMNEARVEPDARVEITGLVAVAAPEGEQGFRDPSLRFQLVAPPDGALRIRGR